MPSLVIDMQEGLLSGEEKHDLADLVERIDDLARRVRRRGGCVVFIQHDGPAGNTFAPSTPGWALLSSIQREPQDLLVHKTLNDAFFGTALQSELTQLGARRVLVTGWATDLCVDATLRSAAALGFKVVAVADCHTVSARPHLSAEDIIEHHHWIWTNLLSQHAVEVTRADEITLS
jgi:nicotinamidase-related amidase